jgi:hypothetical protein
MSQRQRFEKFLQQQQIYFDLSPYELEDKIIKAIHAICKNLAEATPPLLNHNNIHNLQTIIDIAQNEAHSNYFCRDKADGELVYSIMLLSSNSSVLLTQDTFDAFCKFTTSQLSDFDFGNVRECFTEMNRLNLLTPTNIQSLVERIFKTPVRIVEETMEPGVGNLKQSRVDELRELLLSAVRSQEDFDFIMHSDEKVADLSSCMRTLQECHLGSPANYEVLLDLTRSFPTKLPSTLPNLQGDFNQMVYRICSEELNDLGLSMRNCSNTKLLKLSSSLIVEFRNLLEQTNPTDFQGRILHTLAVVKNSLPSATHHPTPQDIEKLKALGEEVKGHPSPLWQSIGVKMVLLSTTIAIAALPFSTIVAAGAAATALAGIGLFAFGRSRTGLSKVCMDLAETVETPIHLMHTLGAKT